MAVLILNRHNILTNTAMNWFFIKMIFRITCGTGNHRPQFNEQWRIIEAPDMYSAVEKAKRFALNEMPALEGLVQWKLIAVTEVLVLSDMADGAELFSTIIETDYAKDYIDSMLLKESCLQQPVEFINQ